MSESQPRIGILPTGGKNWIAGAIYLQNIIRALSRLPKEEWPRLYLIMRTDQQWLRMEDLGGFKPKARRYAFTGKEDRKIRRWWIRQSLMRRHWPRQYESVLGKLNLSAVFPVFDSFGKDYHVPWIGWIPDFQHKHLPQFFSDEELQQRDQKFQGIVDDASHIVVSSQDAYDDLMRWFPTQPERVSILRFTMMPDAQWYQQRPELVIKKYRLPEKFLMFPSQFWAHKNHQVLFEAIRLLKEKGLDDIAVVLTGHQHDYRVPDHVERLKAFISQHHLEAHIHMPGLLERSDQIQLMRAAAAIVQPSLFEGWSSLVEDCRTLGKPMYVSDIPIHREQQPPQAMFFNPHKADELAQVIASDWPHLKPGPDLDREQIAHEQTNHRAIDFGRTFLTIVNKARDSRG